MKKAKRILTLAVVFCFAMVSFVSAAIPVNTIIFGNKAYDVNLLNNAEYMSEILEAFLGNDNSFTVKLPNGKFIGPNLEEESAEDIPAITYVNEEGETIEFEAGDGDEIVA